MSENIPWQPPPEGTPMPSEPWILPKDLYDKIMALPPGSDITQFFEFEPGWDLTVTTQGETWDTTNSPPTTNSQEWSQS